MSTTPEQKQQQQQQNSLPQSPIGARRVRTDLKTSQNIFLATARPSIPRTSSPINIKSVTCGNMQPVQSPLQSTQHTPTPSPQMLHGIHKSHLPHATHKHRSSRRTPTVAVAAAKTMTTTATKSTSTLSGVCNCWCHCAAATVLSTSAPHANATYLSAHLPARATRLLNRSRLQQQQYPSSIASGVTTNAATGSSICGGGGDSDSSKSAHSLRRSAAASRASNASTSSTNASLPPSTHYHHQKPFQHHYSQLHRDSHSSSDDLMLYDKSFRNAMIQDVLQFKKQLLRLRRILQDDEEYLMRTETLNPFDNDNGQLFAACGLDSKLLDDMDLASLTSSTTDDPMMELADLRRQVVYLQGEVEDRERTIRLQKNQIENLESKKPPIQKDHTKELMNIATQTERTRPLSYGLDGLSRSKPEYTSYTTRYHPVATCENNSTCSGANNSNNNNNNNLSTYQQQHNCCNGSNNNLPAAAKEAAAQQIRRHTIISTTLSNYNQQSALAPRRASIAWEKPTAPAPPTTPPLAQTAAAAGTKHAPPAATSYKPVKITLIGEPLKQWQWNAVGNGKTSDSYGHTAAGNHSDKEDKTKREANDGNHKSGSNSSRCGGNGGSGGVSNGKSNGANCTNGSNGYTNGTSSQANGRSEVSGNGLQQEASQQTNHHHQLQIKPHMQQALTQLGQQQQTRVQQQQQQQQVYHTTNGSNGNFNPTVTIV